MKVAVVPGSKFHCTGQATSYLRLSFAMATDDDLNIGVQRLGLLMQKISNAAVTQQKCAAF
jgi:DNA-binding transcriptional MocR family regulator